MHRILLSLALASVPLSQASAQIIIRTQQEPAAWSSLGVGLFDMSVIHDKDTGSEWRFGQGIQYRATLEKALGGGSGIGVVATFAKMPLTYIPAFDLLPGAGSCASSCDATGNVYSVGGVFHMGGGLGLHQVIQINAGATMFGNFREEDSGEKLPPAKVDTDVSVQVGYGIGYTLSPRLQASLVQEFGFIFHPGNGEGGDSRAAQSQGTRLSVRYGMGTKRPARPGIRRR